MKALLKINSQEYLKKILLELLCLDGIMLAVLLLYKWKKSIFFKLMGMIKSMPKELYAFIGIDENIATENCGFFLLFTAMIMLLWFACKAGSNTIGIIFENELSGRVFRLCNQLFTRKQLARMLYVKALVQFYVLYLIWALSLLVMLAIGASNGQQRINSLKLGGKMLIFGALVALVYISLAFLYTSIARSNHATESFGGKIVLVPWVMANVYKLFHAIRWFLESIEKNDWGQSIDSIAVVLQKIYWISPISWCNPFSTAMDTMIVLKVLLCIIISGGAFVSAIFLFEKKNYIDLMY